jgi:hypothetical protein
MKKAVLAACCSLLIAFIVASLRTSLAINPQQPDQVVQSPAVSDLSMQEMTQRSDLIITGQCLATRSMWVERRLVTLATISVNETLKGAPASTVTVTLPGGFDSNRKHPIAMTYPGAPTIQPQENTFLFLRHAASLANTYSVMDYAQGKLSIVKNEAGEDMVSRDLNKMPIARSVGVARGRQQLTPLAEFKEKIKGYMR